MYHLGVVASVAPTMPMKTEHLLVIGYVVTISAIILTFVFMRKRLSSPAKSAESNAIDNTTTQKGGKDKKKKKKARALARMRNRRTGESDDEGRNTYPYIENELSGGIISGMAVSA